MRRRGQSLIEYVLLIILAAGVAGFMFGYLRDSLSHHTKSGADGIGHGLQYKP